ncbi:hypothetical protein B0H14DRAFT_2564789 [Mycena olivaceomarginata]|nr:hypothetical protein B0H14DRAFT_2564789 [Mycena olivaceomarginata]
MPVSLYSPNLGKPRSSQLSITGGNLGHNGNAAQCMYFLQSAGKKPQCIEEEERSLQADKLVNGTGKASLVKALAGHPQRALYIINLGDEGLTDGALRTPLERVPRSSMILVEDLTELSTQRKGDRVQSVILPCLLNALDGVTAPERGVWVFDPDCGRSPTAPFLRVQSGVRVVGDGQIWD